MIATRLVLRNFSVILFICLIPKDMSAQNSFYLTSGFGVPEFLNLGVKYEHDEVQFGICVGGMKMSDGESLFSVSSDLYWHFGGDSELTTTLPWYGRMGVVYSRDENDAAIHKYLYLTFRVGRDFNISENFGIQLDGGVGLQLHEREIEKAGSFFSVDIEIPFIPCIGLGLFYRFD